MARAAVSIIAFFPAMLFIQSANAQNVAVFKCERNGVTVYQSMKEGTDKTCTKFDVYIDPNIGASSGPSSNSNIVRASGSRAPDLNSVASQVQRNRDLKKMELLANELTQEEESLKGLINKASVVTDERELKKINDQKTITINNIDAIKRELGPNAGMALKSASKSAEVTAFNLNQVAPAFAAPTSLPTLPPPSMPTLEVKLEPRMEQKVNFKSEAKPEVKAEPKVEKTEIKAENKTAPHHTVTLTRSSAGAPSKSSVNLVNNVSSAPSVKATDLDSDPIALMKKFMSNK